MIQRRRLIPCLQDIVILKSGCDGDLLRNNQRILEILVWDIVELLAVPCQRRSAGFVGRVVTRKMETRNVHLGITRECPRARGPISKNEKLVRGVRNPVFFKGRQIHSRLLGLDELERRYFPCAHPLSTIQKSRRSRTFDDLAEQAAGESDEGGLEPQRFSMYDFSVPRTGRH